MWNFGGDVEAVKRQSTSYFCGVASIANALEALGIRRSQREIARLCHVTPEAGTNENEMLRALFANGLKVDAWHSAEAKQSDEWLWLQVGNYGPAILSVDACEHWVTVIGVCATDYIIFDPSRNHGIEVHTFATLKERWFDCDDGYYGLGCSR